MCACHPGTRDDARRKPGRVYGSHRMIRQNLRLRHRTSAVPLDGRRLCRARSRFHGTRGPLLECVTSAATYHRARLKALLKNSYPTDIPLAAAKPPRIVRAPTGKRASNCLPRPRDTTWIVNCHKMARYASGVRTVPGGRPFVRLPAADGRVTPFRVRRFVTSKRPSCRPGGPGCRQSTHANQTST